MFGPEVDAACRAHALAEYPKECCGAVVDGCYVPLRNVAADPTKDFQFPPDAPSAYQAVLHSHCAPRHVRAPSGSDLRGQIETAVPWGLVLTDGQVSSDILWWGDHRLDDPLVGQEYIWGAADCWSVIRRWWWQARGVKRRDFARDYEEFRAGGDLFRRHAEDAGLVPIKASQVGPGDVVFMQVRGAVPNHCAVVIENGLMLHHLPGRPSAREPLVRWQRLVTDTLRFEP